MITIDIFGSRSAYAQGKPGVADAAQQENKKLVSRTTELPLPGKGRNPVHVGNLQTKKVASAPRKIPKPNRNIGPSHGCLQVFRVYCFRTLISSASQELIHKVV